MNFTLDRPLPEPIEEEPPEPVEPAIEAQALSGDYGRFVVEPLPQGFGITLGNAMRRVLLGGLTGWAISAVRVEGLQHEFAGIPGAKEDATEFLLNVKAVRIRSLSDRPGVLRLETSGQGEITAGDIEAPMADFEIVNPEQHLVSMDIEDGRLSVEFTVTQGTGYVPAGASEGLPIGVIPVDAIYTPTRKVSYRVEPTRVGQITNYDRLVLDMWTDGTLTPSQAVTRAAEILVEQFAVFRELGRPQVTEPTRPALGGVQVDAERSEVPLEDLQLSVRTFNCLRRAGVSTLGELLAKSKDELLTIRNFGQKSLDELWERLDEMALVSHEEPPAEATGDFLSAGIEEDEDIPMDELPTGPFDPTDEAEAEPRTGGGSSP